MPGQTDDFRTPIDTIVTLEAIPIIAPLRSNQIGTQSVEWGPSDLAQLPGSDLGNLLSSELGAFVRHYGPGSLATASVRGGNAGHTLLLWNGLPLTSPMLGLADLSLFNNHLFESIAMTRGGNSALWGSGAVSGMVSLNNLVPQIDDPILKGSISAGSFGRYQADLNLNLGTSKFRAMSKLSGLAADNDFSYFDARQKKQVPLSHAEYDTKSLMQHLHWQLNEKNKISAHYWFVGTQRNIPPTLTQTISSASQTDAAHRSILHWQHQNRQSIWNVKAAYFTENQEYLDPRSQIDALNHFSTLLADTEFERLWGKTFSTLIGTTFSRTLAQSRSYQKDPIELRGAVFTSLTFHKARWKMQGSLRQEWTDDMSSPLLPRIGLQWQFKDNLSIHGNISRNYRLPTLNDRYWSPGGNVALRPEEGWSQELGLIYKLDRTNRGGSFGSTYFNRNISGWILWRPVSNQLYWQPENIARVWSRGWENHLSYYQQLDDFFWEFQLQYHLVKSTNEIDLQQPKIAKGSQLIYIPRHMTSATLTLEHNQLSLVYRHQFISESTGINDLVPAFDVGNLSIRWSSSTQRQMMVLLQLNNLWNQSFQIVERRPMPGFNWQLSLRVSTKKRNRSHIKITK